MRGQTVILATLAVLVLLGSVTLAQAGRQPPLSWYVAGGGYRLTGLAWQVSGTASGGRYRLVGPASPGEGNQCCCTYLPCVVRNFH
jgi:hypothetical protein